jgi:hypothetical protein
VSEFNSQHQHADPLADARAWLEHMERTIARLAAERTLAKENDRPSGMATLTPLNKHDQQFEDRSRVAERLVRDLREAEYTCDVADGGDGRAI